MDWIGQITRLPYARGLWKRFPVGPLDLRVKWGILPEYPAYAYGVYCAAQLAAGLGIARVSALELGVAGGRGLLALERIAAEVEQRFGVGIDVIGFDTGNGMPEPVDYRDMQHVWTHGFYRMEVDRLRERLTRATLVLGDIGQTGPQWLAGSPAPIGFVAFDLDYYSSTTKAFGLFEGGPATHLPRVHCYFDDIAGPEFACMNDYVGELLAIQEFNAAHASRKICQIRNLRCARKRDEPWYVQMYAFHDFAHPHYTDNVAPKGESWRQLPI
jgi:hypothetical protein